MYFSHVFCRTLLSCCPISSSYARYSVSVSRIFLQKDDGGLHRLMPGKPPKSHNSSNRSSVSSPYRNASCPGSAPGSRTVSSSAPSRTASGPDAQKAAAHSMSSINETGEMSANVDAGAQHEGMLRTQVAACNQAFVCHIGKHLMSDPVVAADGTWPCNTDLRTPQRLDLLSVVC